MWLNATPKDAKSKRIEDIEKLLGHAPRMPECDALYLYEYLLEIGPTEGNAKLSSREILAWMQCTGVELSAWEFRTVRALSGEFLAESERSFDPNAIAPWADPALANTKYTTNRNLATALALQEQIQRAAEL